MPSLGVCRPVHYVLPYFATLSFDHRSSLSRTTIHPRTACFPTGSGSSDICVGMSDFFAMRPLPCSMTVVQYKCCVLSAWLALFLMLTTEVTKVPFLATDPPCIYHVLVGWIIGRKLQGSHHSIHNWSLQNSVPIIWWCDIPILRYMPRKSNIGFFCWLVYIAQVASVIQPYIVLILTEVL